MISGMFDLEIKFRLVALQYCNTFMVMQIKLLLLFFVAMKAERERNVLLFLGILGYECLYFF